MKEELTLESLERRLYLMEEAFNELLHLVLPPEIKKKIVLELLKNHLPEKTEDA